MDDADRTTEREETLDGLMVLSHSNFVAAMVVGCQGECFKCGNESARLMDSMYFRNKGRKALAQEIEQAKIDDPTTNIKGVCAPCRDRYQLP